jgi:hypothetical protein
MNASSSKAKVPPAATADSRKRSAETIIREFQASVKGLSPSIKHGEKVSVAEAFRSLQEVSLKPSKR